MSERAQDQTILCVGRLYCDLIFTGVPRFPKMGTEVFADGFGLHAGGGAFITAAHLSRLGNRVALGAFLPTVPFQDVVHGELVKAGLETAFCQTAAPGADPQLTVAITDSSDRAFLTRRSGAAYPEISVAELRRFSVKHIHIGELATLVERPNIVGVARAAGASVSLDCGWDDGLAANDIGSIIGDIDLFLPNESEARHLKSIGVPEPMTALTVVKQGAKGATAYDGNGQVSAPASRVDVVDTTGAGDAFNAGFISAWLDQCSLPECLRAGNAQGALAISQLGGFQCADALEDEQLAAVSSPQS
ncbi:MAG: carbohydrate kinase [Boseongicola sp.]|nr:MAG: carbohydrate kinase [Boseongicola sp.]